MLFDALPLEITVSLEFLQFFRLRISGRLSWAYACQSRRHLLVFRRWQLKLFLIQDH
jgi:hypothetical protein